MAPSGENASSVQLCARAGASKDSSRIISKKGVAKQGMPRGRSVSMNSGVAASASRL